MTKVYFYLDGEYKYYIPREFGFNYFVKNEENHWNLLLSGWWM